MDTNTTLVPDSSDNNHADVHQRRKCHKPKIMLLVGIAVILLVGLFITGAAIQHQAGKKQQGELLTTAELEKIVEVNELSTYRAYYNGIVEVPNEEDPEKVDYYVSYESQVKVGIDLEDVKESVDSENNKIVIVLPKLKIIDVNVDFGSMDFIFVEEDAETETVAQRAYKACIADVNSECENEMDIYLLAQKNAEKIVKALVDPLVSTMNHQYELDIRWEGQ